LTREYIIISFHFCSFLAFYVWNYIKAYIEYLAESNILTGGGFMSINQYQTTDDRFDKGNRARIGYDQDGTPLLVVANDLSPIIKSYSLAFGDKGELSFRIIFSDDSTSDFSVDIERQGHLYESLIRHMGFVVALSAEVGNMRESGKVKGMRCTAKPFPIHFNATQLDALQSAFTTYKLNYSE
jgi:hypothetical protein